MLYLYTAVITATWLGSHGTFWKQVFYEGAVKVPLMFCGPHIGQGQQIETPTSLLDLGPTLLSAVDAEAMIETDGVDLWPAIQGNKRPNPNRFIISQLANRLPHQLPTAMIRQGSYKLICHGVNDHRPQLFNLAVDPERKMI